MVNNSVHIHCECHSEQPRLKLGSRRKGQRRTVPFLSSWKVLSSLVVHHHSRSGVKVASLHAFLQRFAGCSEEVAF